MNFFGFPSCTVKRIECVLGEICKMIKSTLCRNGGQAYKAASTPTSVQLRCCASIMSESARACTMLTFAYTSRMMRTQITFDEKDLRLLI